MADQEKNLIKQAGKLLVEIKKANSDFDKKTSKIISDAKKTGKALEEMDLDGDMKRIEKEGVSEIDSAVLDFLKED